MNINNPGLSTGMILGTVCLLAGIGMKIWAPEFSGFFDRGHDSQPIPIYVILLVLAAINFGYALITRKLVSRSDPPNEEQIKSTPEQGKSKQD